LRLDTQGDEEFDLAQQTELKLLYHQLFITNTAQTGRTLVLSLGRGDFGFPGSPQKREQKIIIASTTTPLAGAGVYTSDAFDSLNYGRVTLLVLSDVISAANGVEIQQSIDGTNWDYATQNTALSGVGLAVSAETVGRWVRISYTNGGVAQTTFRLAALARAMP